MKPVIAALLIILLAAGCSDSGPPIPDAEANDIIMPAKLVAPLAPARPEEPEATENDGPYIPKLEISREFGISQPEDGLVTELDEYFIAGTSSPEAPLYFGPQLDEELERPGESGLFGVHVELEEGENVFEFTQGEETKSVTITRQEPQAATMGTIRQSSMVPEIFAGAKAGGALELGCIAPAGAEITATFAGETAQLEQAEEDIEEGIPAFFTGKLQIPAEGFAEKETVNAGKVSYEMDFGGETQKFESSGAVYVAGAAGRFAVRVESYMAFCYPDSSMSELPFSCEKLKRGAADYVISEGNGYVELANGGFVGKTAVRPLTGEVDISNELLAANSYIGHAGENYTFAGTARPAYLTSLTESEFSITLYNTYGSENLSVAGSRLFTSVEAVSAGNLVNYTFALKSDIWGYTVDYSGRATVLAFYYKPQAASLKGVRVALDPGHGGDSPGAAGVAGRRGPLEKDINLAHTLALKEKLEQKGASVFLARENDESVNLDGRLKFPEDVNADIYVSIHHNSVGRNLDANEISGAEAYYHTPMSQPLAERLMEAITGLGREERFVEESYYRVTLNPRCPAVMLELGYMSNPLEYETAASEAQIERFAAAAAEAIESIFK